MEEEWYDEKWYVDRYNKLVEEYIYVSREHDLLWDYCRIYEVCGDNYEKNYEPKINNFWRRSNYLFDEIIKLRKYMRKINSKTL